jgi:hypothetical protein
MRKVGSVESNHTGDIKRGVPPLSVYCKLLRIFKVYSLKGSFDLGEFRQVCKPALERNPTKGGGVLGGYPKQIERTRAESQQIVATRPLYCLQYSVLSKSSAKDLPQ